jgi:hypothetical protein
MGDERTVKVFCAVPNGLRLRLFKRFDDGTGLKSLVPSGEEVVLQGPRSPASDFEAKPVENVVPAEFWDRWLEANEGSTLVSERLVYAEDPEKRG